jgi:hypothetical protein
MLRKTLMTLIAFAALGIGSTATAMHGSGGGGGGHGWGGGGGHGWGGGGAGFTAMHGPMMHAGPMVTAPMTGSHIQGWSSFGRSKTAWGFHDRFHHRFHHRNFFAFGFGGPVYDYAYTSCWTQVPTRYGWRWVYVCGDYGYY